MSGKSEREDQEMDALVVADELPANPRRFPYLLWPIWIVWLPLLIPPALDMIRSEPSVPRVIATLSGVVLFVSIYVWATWRNARELGISPAPLAETPPAKWLIIGSLLGLSMGLALLGRVNSSWLDTFIFTGAYVSGSLPPRKALPTVGVVVLLSLASGWAIGLNWFDVVQTNIILIVTWVTTISLVRAFVANRALDTAREEIARLAVMNERLRIARDLHDLLGHNLSLIALKSELARRLIDSSPERAAVEISDVENVARSTLQEVREAVGRYRQPTLSSELHGAQEILAAAGIAYRYEGLPGAIDSLPSAVESALAWAVREGVTNVIRHSRAHRCTIRAVRDETQVMVEIIDDGLSAVPETLSLVPSSAVKNSAGNGGHGLRGLHERVLALGGYCESGGQPAGGFRLAVSVPLVLSNRALADSDPNKPKQISPLSTSDSGVAS